MEIFLSIRHNWRKWFPAKLNSIHGFNYFISQTAYPFLKRCSSIPLHAPIFHLFKWFTIPFMLETLLISLPSDNNHKEKDVSLCITLIVFHFLFSNRNSFPSYFKKITKKKKIQGFVANISFITIFYKKFCPPPPFF